MSVSNVPIYPQTIINATQIIAPADTTTVKSLVAAGTNGTKIESIIVQSTDTSNRDLALYATISGTNYPLTTIQIPLNAGNTNSVPAVDIIRSAQIPGFCYDTSGNKYLYLANGTTLSIATLTTVTTAKQITVFAQGGNF